MVVCLLSAAVTNAQSVPPPWAGHDIGAPTLVGTSSFADGLFSIEAGGIDIAGTADQFHFIYQQVSGDVDFRARVDSLSRAHVWSKAGLMIRNSLAPGAAHGAVFMTADKGTGFARRIAEGDRATSTGGSSGLPSPWLRIVRTGNAVTAYSSSDGSAWTPIGNATIELGTTAYVGIAVTARSRSARTSAILSNVEIAGSSNGPIDEGLPEGQTSADIGSPMLAGSASYSAGEYTVRGTGADIWDARDQFHYVYQPVSGDFEAVGRVQSLTAADAAAKGGIMIRETLAPGSRHALIYASPGSGYGFVRRSQTDSWSEHTNGGAGAAPGWLRLAKKGADITAYRSPDGSTWTTIGSATIPMGDTVYVGIAVTSHDVSTAATATVDNLRVTLTPVTANMPPAVLVSSPASGTTYPAPADVTFTASATDPDGSVARVDFHANGTFLGRDTTAPYSHTASLPEGTHSITAVAVDDDGATTISDPVILTVNPGTEVPPPTTEVPRAIAFTASADHDTLVIKYVLEVYAAGATPGVSSPVATLDLGKPALTSTGEVIVDCSAFFQALAPGTYLATVMAVGTESGARSAPVTFTR